ncbi:hypothetical protein [Tuberibacillus sp. Marseille-P3662]|uniref:hypothetical protein n=1 Tax=Tuberibacillus sp. Marseille-P3662 TaxID=1965358 RepID=UPI00111C5C88|nr:hypothetical protein [Tuberibacillus sp. Marseille-P3662]
MKKMITTNAVATAAGNEITKTGKGEGFMEQQAKVNESGNSHVYVEVDTRPMAYAMLSTMHATGRFSDDEMNEMVSNMRLLNSENSVKFYSSENDPKRARLFV